MYALHALRSALKYRPFAKNVFQDLAACNSLETIVAKNNRNHSNSLDIPTQLRRRSTRFSDRGQQLAAGKSEALRRCSMPARRAPTSTRDMNETESFVMIGSRDLEQRIRFESACRSLTSVDTFFTSPSRA